jgi:phosphatidylglycerol:prolipoprotein diacylglycerol transferase
MLVIDINIDPTMFDVGPFTLTWHGFFTAVGIIAGVSLAVYLCKRDGIPTEAAQEIALVAVVCAIVGARLFFVFEHFDRFSESPQKIITGISEGGITLYGGLIAGVLGGLAYALWRRWPIAITLDAAAPGMILGQAIGRIGDLINGEHLATRSDLPWAVKYTNPNNTLLKDQFGVPVHPTAGGYELLGDLLILAILVFVLRRLWKTPGWVFCSYLILYGVLRFFMSYMRIDEQTIGDIPIPQLVSAGWVGLGLVLASVFTRWTGPITREYARRAWGRTDEDETKPRGRRRPAHA